MTIKVVVPISGGKDSQACLKLALETYDKSEVMGLFCDTQFEHQLTYQHIEWIKDNYGVHIETINNGSVYEKVIKHNRFPGGGARHCTDELKIIPSKWFYRDFAKKQGGFQVWYGMRGNESPERTKRYKDKIDSELYPPHEVLKKYPQYLHKLGVSFRLPILEWSSNDVFDYLNGEENPLYAMGFDRVGCFPCLASGDKWKEKAFSHDNFGREQRVIVSELEKKIGRSIFTSKGGSQRNNENQTRLDMDYQGCSICIYT